MTAPVSVEDATVVLQWLIDHPVELDSILTLARLEYGLADQDVAEFAPRRTVERQREHVAAWMAAARLVQCDRCLQPVILWADGGLSDWPERTVHRCRRPQPLAPMPATEREAAERGYLVGSGPME